MLTDSVRYSQIKSRDRNTRELMHHLEMPKAILFWFDVECRGNPWLWTVCSTVSGAFKGELRHIMKSANRKQLARERRKEKNTLSYIVIGTFSSSIYNPVDRGEYRHANRAASLTSCRWHRTWRAETMLCDSDLGAVQPSIKHLWEPAGVTLGLLLRTSWTPCGLCINITFSSHRFMNLCETDSEFLNQTIIDSAQTL